MFKYNNKVSFSPSDLTRYIGSPSGMDRLAMVHPDSAPQQAPLMVVLQRVVYVLEANIEERFMLDGRSFQLSSRAIENGYFSACSEDFMGYRLEKAIIGLLRSKDRRW